MKISFISSEKKQTTNVLVPIWKADNIKDILAKIGEKYNFPNSFFSTNWKAEEKDVVSVFSDKHVVYLIGLGKTLMHSNLTRCTRTCVHKNKTIFPAALGLDLTFAEAQNGTDTALLSATVNGAILGKYNNNLYKTNLPKKKGFLSASSKLIIETTTKSSVAKAVTQEAIALAEAQVKIFDLVNKPANKKNPATLVALARKNGKDSGYKLKVISGNDVVKQGLHSLHAVGQASPSPSALIIMDYKPKKASKHTIALIGKGVTYDTGGISLKPSHNMHLMKSDMGGAAAVMGAMDIIAKMNLPIHVVGVVAAAENNIGSTAIKPGDIINSFSGKTIEVLNTDAEGRLVLADGIAYANKYFKPDVMIDLATLTGSIVRAIGKHAAGLFTKNEDLAAQLIATGQSTGERLWPMPMWDEYADEMKSDIADIKNLASSPNAGSITAAKFLEEFTNNHKKWAHLDIAAQAMIDNEFSNQANATAFGVSLLYHFVKNYQA